MQALEFQVQQGLSAGAAKEELWLAPASTAQTALPGGATAGRPLAGVRHTGELHANVAVLKLLVGPGDERWLPAEL